MLLNLPHALEMELELLQRGDPEFPKQLPQRWCPQRMGQSVKVEKGFNFVSDGPFQKRVDVETSFKGVFSQMKD